MKKKELIDRWETDSEWISKRIEIQGINATLYWQNIDYFLSTSTDF